MATKVKLKLQPVAGTKNRVFVQPTYPGVETTSTGIIASVPAWMERDEKGVSVLVEKPIENYGVVLGVSEADELGVKPNVKVGDTVYFNQNYQKDTFEGIEYLIMKEGNIYAKL